MSSNKSLFRKEYESRVTLPLLLLNTCQKHSLQYVSSLSSRMNSSSYGREYEKRVTISFTVSVIENVSATYCLHNSLPQPKMPPIFALKQFKRFLVSLFITKILHKLILLLYYRILECATRFRAEANRLAY